MTESQLCYWIQGYFELLAANDEQVSTSATDAFYDCLSAHIHQAEVSAMHRNASSPLSQQIAELKFLAKYRMPLSDIQKVVHECFETIDKNSGIGEEVGIHQTYGSWEPEDGQLLKC